MPFGINNFKPQKNDKRGSKSMTPNEIVISVICGVVANAIWYYYIKIFNDK